MISRDQLVTTLVMGVAGGAVGISTALLIRFGFPLEPAMALLGALIGASATVAGAVWVADRNRNSELMQEIALLVTDYSALVKAAEHGQRLQPMGEEVWKPEFRTAIQEFGWKTRGSRMITDQALERSRALNFRHMAALRDLHSMLLFAEQFYSDCFETEEELHPMDERSWPSMFADVIERTTETMKILKDGLA